MLAGVSFTWYSRNISRADERPFRGIALARPNGMTWRIIAVERTRISAARERRYLASPEFLGFP
jgi:hypothetical protein